MLYAFLGSTLVGALAVALLLWRNALLKRDLAEERASKKAALEQSQRALDELQLRGETFADQLARQREQIDTLRTQRDAAITKLEASGAPGSITDILRLRLKVPGA